jgi:hypothetical protein
MDEPADTRPEHVSMFASRRNAGEDETGGVERELIAMLQQAGSNGRKERATTLARGDQATSKAPTKSARQPDIREDDPLDEAGHALIAMLQKAADASNAEYDRASILAGRLSGELRANENRIKELESEVLHFRDRATRAEEWLEVISREIESKLIAPRRGGPA